MAWRTESTGAGDDMAGRMMPRVTGRFPMIAFTSALRRFTWLGAIAIAAAVPSLVTGQAPRVTVFDGARILDGNGGEPIESGRIVVQDGRITAVGPQSSVTMPAGAARIVVTG